MADWLECPEVGDESKVSCTRGKGVTMNVKNKCGQYVFTLHK